jgi:hypothetical protein
MCRQVNETKITLCTVYLMGWRNFGNKARRNWSYLMDLPVEIWRCGIWYHVGRLVSPDVAEESDAFIFQGTNCRRLNRGLSPPPPFERWRQDIFFGNVTFRTSDSITPLWQPEVSQSRLRFGITMPSIDQKMRLTKGLETSSSITVPFTAEKSRNLVNLFISPMAWSECKYNRKQTWTSVFSLPFGFIF